VGGSSGGRHAGGGAVGSAARVCGHAAGAARSADLRQGLRPSAGVRRWTTVVRDSGVVPRRAHSCSTAPHQKWAPGACRRPASRTQVPCLGMMAPGGGGGGFMHHYNAFLTRGNKGVGVQPVGGLHVTSTFAAGALRPPRLRLGNSGASGWLQGRCWCRPLQRRRPRAANGGLTPRTTSATPSSWVRSFIRV